MGRRYVRDKIGRFASHGGGGSFGGGGKIGKSAKNVKARKSYKEASGKLRSMKKVSGGAKDAKDRKFWNKSLGGAKSGMTRVTNRLTSKRAAKAKVSSKRERAATKAKALATERKLQKKNLASVKKAKATRAKTAAKKKAVATKKAEAKKATAAKKKVAAKKKTYGGLTPKQQYKAARSKARAAKSGYAQDRGQGYDRAGKASGKGKVKRSMKLPGSDSARGVGSAKAQVTKLQKKFGKGATKGKGYGVSKKGQAAKSKFKDLKKQRGGVTKGKGTVAQRKKSLNVRTTQQAFGMKVKKPVSKAAQKYIGKQNVEASRVSASRGKGSKAKRRAADLAKKVPRTAKGAMAYDGPNKAASRARDRIIAKTKAKNAKSRAGKKKVKAPTAFSGTGKYARQGKLSKASKGSGAKQKYKKATSELRKSKRGQSLFKQSQMGHPSKVRQGQVTRLTNKFTNRRAAATGETNLSRGLKRVDRVKALKTTKNPSTKRYELNYLKQSKALGKKLKNTKINTKYTPPKLKKGVWQPANASAGNKIVKFNRKKKR